MKRENIFEADAECERFKKRVAEYFKAHKSDHPMSGDYTTAAIRRASMDLSKALSKLRTDNKP